MDKNHRRSSSSHSRYRRSRRGVRRAVSRNDPRRNRSVVAQQAENSWAPKGKYSIKDGLEREIEDMLRKIEDVKRKKMILDQRYYIACQEHDTIKRRFEEHEREAKFAMRSCSQKLKHSRFNGEVVRSKKQGQH